MAGINTAYQFGDYDDVAGLRSSTQGRNGHDWTKADMFSDADFDDTRASIFPRQEIACSGSVDDIDARHLDAVRARIGVALGDF